MPDAISMIIVYRENWQTRMHTLVQQYFSESANRFPDKMGVNCADQSSSFADSERLSNAIANHLRKDGVRRASFIPFFMSKSVHCVHAILSILKSDCAYVPIDINSPGNRILSILEACEAPLVIVDSNSRRIF